MRRITFLLLAASLISGCVDPVERKRMDTSFDPATFPAGQPPQEAPPVKAEAAKIEVVKPEAEKVVVTPSNALRGTVVRVRAEFRFAVLYFPVGNVPALKSTVHVYRGGVKVGELQVNGPQQDENIVADIMGGEVQAGDEIRTE